MSNRKNINTNVEKKDATAVAHEIKGELTYEDKVIQKIIGLSLENVSKVFWESTVVSSQILKKKSLTAMT